MGTKMRVRPRASTRTGRRLPSDSSKKRSPCWLAARRGQDAQADGSLSPAHGPSAVSRQCSVTMRVGALVRLRPNETVPASSRAIASASSSDSSSGNQMQRAPSLCSRRAVSAFHTEMGAATSHGTPALRAISMWPRLRQTTAAAREHSSRTREMSTARLASSKMTVTCGSRESQADGSSSSAYAGTYTVALGVSRNNN